jgi:spermidine/putrescine transport system substrate-binding protein
MVARLIRLGWVQELDKDNIPNAQNLEDSLADVEFDPGRKFSLPWQSGFAGIGYNPEATNGKKIESIDQLLTDKALKGRVTLLTEMRDTVGLVLLALGKDLSNFTDADFEEAIGELQKARDAGQLRGFTGNEYTSGLASGRSPRASPGPATSCSSRRTTRSSATRCRPPATRSGRTTS